MSVKEYFSKFVKLSKYSSSPVANCRDEMSIFVTSVSKDLVEDFWEAMLHDNVDLVRLMGESHQVEESRRKRRVQEGKKCKTTNHIGSSSGTSLFGVWNRTKLKNYSGNSTLYKNMNAKVNKTGLKKDNDRNSQ